MSFEKVLLIFGSSYPPSAVILIIVAQSSRLRISDLKNEIGMNTYEIQIIVIRMLFVGYYRVLSAIYVQKSDFNEFGWETK